MFVSPFGKEFVFVVVSSEDCSDYVLHPAESEIIGPYATEKRRSEFVLGRKAANKALNQLGFVPHTPVLKGLSGEPIWPTGVRGSITHSGGSAVVVVAKDNVVDGVGIDLQRLGVKSYQGVAERICTERELEWGVGR